MISKKMVLLLNEIKLIQKLFNLLLQDYSCNNKRFQLQGLVSV